MFSPTLLCEWCGITLYGKDFLYDSTIYQADAASKIQHFRRLRPRRAPSNRTPPVKTSKVFVMKTCNLSVNASDRCGDVTRHCEGGCCVIGIGIRNAQMQLK